MKFKATHKSVLVAFFVILSLATLFVLALATYDHSNSKARFYQLQQSEKSLLIAELTKAKSSAEELLSLTQSRIEAENGNPDRIQKILLSVGQLAAQLELPVEGVNKYQEHKRDRWLDADELERLWSVLERYSYHPTSYLFKLLLLTGACKGEMMNAKWEQFDLEKGLWEKPSHLTKQKKKEYLPLSEKALDALQTLKKLNLKDSEFVFPGRVVGQPIKEIKTFWKKVLKESNLENVRIHDLRHTHASILSQMA